MILLQSKCFIIQHYTFLILIHEHGVYLVHSQLIGIYVRVSDFFTKISSSKCTTTIFQTLRSWN